MGCFQDSAARDLPTEIDVRPLTVEGCVFKCGRLGFSMAGVQSSSLCFCGTTYSRYGRLRNEQCNMRCTGNYKEICGGFLRSSLYYTGKTKCPNKCKIKQLTRDKFRILATDVLWKATLSSSLPLKIEHLWHLSSYCPYSCYYTINKKYCLIVY